MINLSRNLKLTLSAILCGLAVQTALAQTIVTEWQSPPGAQAASMFQDGLLPRAAMLDYNDDGLNELTVINANGVFRVIDGATQQVLVQASELASIPMQQYRFFGFADMADEDDKELTFVPKFNLDNDVIFTKIGTGGTMPPGTGVQCPANDSIYWLCSYTTGWDADPYQEFAFYSPAGGYLVVGNGYTAGLQAPAPAPTEQFGPLTECNKLAVDWTSGPNVSWPSDDTDFLPEGANDFNGNGVNDLAYIWDTMMWVFDPALQEVLLSAHLPAAAWAANPAPTPRVVGYFDFCGDGQKQILIGWPTRNVSNIPLHRLRDLMILIPPTTGLQDSFVVHYPTEVLGDLTPNPDLFAGRAVADPDQDGKMELVMQHRINRRLVTLELQDSNTVQPPVVFSEATFSSPAAAPKTPTDYNIVMKWETDPGLRPFFDLSARFDAGQLDFDGDGTVDIVVWEENATDTLAVGCQVYDLATQSLLWDFTFPADAAGDTLRRFHGFHDVNADGEKEALLGSRTVVTRDETIHQPFGEFRIIAVLDMDSDGFPDVVGRTPDGRLQVWGAGTTGVREATTGDPAFRFSLFPNPATDGPGTLELEIDRAGDYRWRLLDLRGRQLRTTDLGRLQPGSHLVPIGPLDDLAAGVYLVQLSGPTGTRTVRLVKS